MCLHTTMKLMGIRRIATMTSTIKAMAKPGMVAEAASSLALVPVEKTRQRSIKIYKYNRKEK